jgi:citrate lyase subunit beta/citryl-CoA lyase
VVAALRAQPLAGRLFVRINEPHSPHIEADLRAALSADIDGVVVPKIERAEDLQRIGAALTAARHRRPLAIIGGIESILGAVNVFALAGCEPRLCAIYFGAEDFITDMGGRRTEQGMEVLYARSRTVLAAKAAGIDAIDQAVIEIRDDARFRADGTQARDLGYGGKICLLPRQVELANELFAPTAAEIDRSRRLLAAAAGQGVIEFEGRMIDGPLLKRAQGIVDLAEKPGGSTDENS